MTTHAAILADASMPSLVGRQLGEPVETMEIAQNFAEISVALKA